MRDMKQLASAFAALFCTLLFAAVTTPVQVKASDCVDLARPKPSASYVIQQTESTGKSSTVTQVWESISDTGSRVRWTGPAGTWIQVNEHHIVDDVSVLDRTLKLDTNGGLIEATTFRPGVVGDPAFRACAGKSWPIPAVTALFQTSTMKVTSQTAAGTLRIVGVRERMTTPAGTFDTVHYVRASQSTNEYWKSIEHGVVVKHTGSAGGNAISETLISIK
jgi:hypothetical protein